MMAEALPIRIETKFAGLELERVNGDGSFSGYASLFGEPDLAKDVVERGAFTRSLAARGAAGVRMLFQHDPNQPIGVWNDIREDARGLALIDQTWRLVVDGLPASGALLVMRHPLREILAVTAYAADGTPAVLTAADYDLDALSRPARLFIHGAGGTQAVNGIEVEFVAGFGEAGPDVPDLLRRAIIRLAAHWYEFRASYGPADQPVGYPADYDRMIAGYRERQL